MKPLINDCSKRVFKRLPLLFGFVFALCLVVIPQFVFASVSSYSNVNARLYQLIISSDIVSTPLTPNTVLYSDSPFYVKKWAEWDNSTTRYNVGTSNGGSYDIYANNGDGTYSYTSNKIFTSSVACQTNGIIFTSTGLVYDTVFVNNTPVNNPIYTPVPVASSVKFIQPNSTPFKDTTSGYNFLISYTVPSNTPVSAITIKVNGVGIDDANWSITSQEHNVASGDGWLKCFATNVSIGSHLITANVNTRIATTTIERLAGSVDANGDGIDDRTNLPVDNGTPPLVDNPHGAIESINSLTDFMSSMKDFSTRIFSFMPSEIKVVMIFVITVGGFIAIKRFLL